MSEISNREKKFIERNFKQLSIEKLARQTGLKPDVIRSLIDEYTPTPILYNKREIEIALHSDQRLSTHYHPLFDLLIFFA